jgi:hypothetical protein
MISNSGRKPPAAIHTEGARWQNVIITLAGQIAESLPPNGIDFLVFQVFWRTHSPLKRLEPNLQGERSMSIGR